MKVVLFTLLGGLAFFVAGYFGVPQLLDGKGWRRLSGLLACLFFAAIGLGLWGYGLGDPLLEEHLP